MESGPGGRDTRCWIKSVSQQFNQNVKIIQFIVTQLLHYIHSCLIQIGKQLYGPLIVIAAIHIGNHPEVSEPGRLV